MLPDIGIVALGGAAGSLARYLLTLGIDGAGGDPAAVGAFPIATFSINVLGAFLLGFLVESIVRLQDAAGGRERWRNWRLLIGTGALGGFTTYSLLAADAARLLLDGRWGILAAYGLGTLLIGGVASLLGILAGRASTRRRDTGAGEPR